MVLHVAVALIGLRCLHVKKLYLDSEGWPAVGDILTAVIRYGGLKTTQAQ